MGEAIASDDTKRPFYEPGWYQDLSNKDYHGSFGTSSSELKKLIEKTPAHLFYSKHHKTEPTKSMELGTAVHTLVLEPEKFEQDVAVMPVLNARTKEGKATKESFLSNNVGKTIITPDQLKQAKAMAESVLSHPTASILLQDIVTESSVYWWYKSMDADDDTQYKEMLKVRPDAISKSHSVIIDLKTSTDASFSGFNRSILNYYYHVSAAMYLEGVNQCKPLLQELGHFAYTKFLFIVVESEAPYLTAVYELSPEYLEIGKHLYRYTLREMRRARDENFPGFPDDIRVIEPPAYANRLFTV